MRGEYSWGSAGVITKAELPPRARRIPNDAFSLLSVVGTTSACAENTVEMIKNHRGGGNYLRVRGEYLSSFCYMFFESELPPRARRIRFEDATEGSTEGTTSACAENTSSASQIRH